MKAKLFTILGALAFSISSAEVWSIGYNSGTWGYPESLAYVEFAIPNQYRSVHDKDFFYAGRYGGITYRSCFEKLNFWVPVEPHSIVEACSIKFHIYDVTGSPVTINISFTQNFDIKGNSSILYSQTGNAPVVASYTFNTGGDYVYPFDYNLLTPYNSDRKIAVGLKSADENNNSRVDGKMKILVYYYQLPNAPSHFTVSPKCTYADFSWWNPEGPQDGFFLDISQQPFPNNNYQRYVIPDSNTRNMRINNLTPTTRYYVRICGYRQGVYDKYCGNFSYLDFYTTSYPTLYLHTWGSFENVKPPVHLRWYWNPQFPGVPPSEVEKYCLFDDQYPPNPYPWAAYRTWWPGSTLEGYTWLWFSPYHYWIGAYHAEGWPSDPNLPWLFSQDFTILPGGGADPLVAHCADSLALYPSWSQKIVVDSLENLHIVYTSGDSVYYIFSNDKGKSFSNPVAIAQGKFPACGISNLGLEVVYLSENKIYYIRKTEYWSPQILIYENPGLINILPPAFAIDKDNNLAYLTWNEQFTEYAQISKATIDLMNTKQVVAYTIDQSVNIQDFASPSISIKPDGTPLIVWSKIGKIYINDGVEIKMIETGDGYAINPMVTAVGDNIKVIWETVNGAGLKQINYTEKTWWGWTKPIALIESELTTPPIITGTGCIIYSEHKGNLFYLNYLGVSEDGWHLYSRQIVYNDIGIKDLHAISSGCWPKIPIYILFYRPDQQIKLVQTSSPEIPLIYLNCGIEQSPYTIGYYENRIYSNLPIHCADIDSEKLEYYFTGLKPHKRYRIKITAYQDDYSVLREWIKVDNTTLGLFKVQKGKITVFEKWLPPSVYSDGVISLSVEKQNSIAIANQIFILEYERGANEQSQKQNTQSYVEYPTPIILSVSPNPFTNHIHIVVYSYNECACLEFKIYDATGRIVKKISLNNLKIGKHSIIWDGTDDNGKPVANGVYFLDADNGMQCEIKKIIIIR